MKMSKKKENETKNENDEMQEQFQLLTERNAQLQSTAQNLANQLNTYMGLTSQYEGTIGVMSQRLQEKDNIIAQLNAQVRQTGGE
jgi:uncharacterized protein YlxW (UPF0749 family)